MNKKNNNNNNKFKEGLKNPVNKKRPEEKYLPAKLLRYIYDTAGVEDFRKITKEKLNELSQDPEFRRKLRNFGIGFVSFAIIVAGVAVYYESEVKPFEERATSVYIGNSNNGIYVDQDTDSVLANSLGISDNTLKDFIDVRKYIISQQNQPYMHQYIMSNDEGYMATNDIKMPDPEESFEYLEKFVNVWDKMIKEKIEKEKGNQFKLIGISRSERRKDDGSKPRNYAEVKYENGKVEKIYFKNKLEGNTEDFFSVYEYYKQIQKNKNNNNLDTIRINQMMIEYMEEWEYLAGCGIGLSEVHGDNYFGFETIDLEQLIEEGTVQFGFSGQIPIAGWAAETEQKTEQKTEQETEER